MCVWEFLLLLRPKRCKPNFRVFAYICGAHISGQPNINWSFFNWILGVCSLFLHCSWNVCAYPIRQTHTRDGSRILLFIIIHFNHARENGIDGRCQINTLENVNFVIQCVCVCVGWTRWQVENGSKLNSSNVNVWWHNALFQRTAVSCTYSVRVEYHIHVSKSTMSVNCRRWLAPHTFLFLIQFFNNIYVCDVFIFGLWPVFHTAAKHTQHTHTHNRRAIRK